MIKGCHKNVVFLKDTGSELFDEAYFVVKPSIKSKPHSDIITEAMEIVSGLCEKRQKRHFKGFVIGLFLGTLIGGGIAIFFV